MTPILLIALSAVAAVLVGNRLPPFAAMVDLGVKPWACAVCLPCWYAVLFALVTANPAGGPPELWAAIVLRAVPAAGLAILLLRGYAAMASGGTVEPLSGVQQAVGAEAVLVIAQPSASESKDPAHSDICGCPHCRPDMWVPCERCGISEVHKLGGRRVCAACAT